jgi:hypothetical protein
MRVMMIVPLLAAMAGSDWQSTPAAHGQRLDAVS